MSFHHNAIRRILGIKWNQVREKHIKNKEVRGLLCNIPNKEEQQLTSEKSQDPTTITTQKKYLIAWINQKRKIGAPQLTCNNNFATSIKKILPPEKSYQTNKPIYANGYH